MVQVADADFWLYTADIDTLLVLERDAFMRMARQLRQVLYESQHHVDGEFHWSRVGHETIRQVRSNPFIQPLKHEFYRKIRALTVINGPFYGALIKLRDVAHQHLFLIVRSMKPTDNLGVAMASLGEGWHNYHHAFPWDYRTGELGTYRLNITTIFIHFFAYLGLAYDLKAASPSMIKKRAIRSGDGSY